MNYQSWFEFLLIKSHLTFCSYNVNVYVKVFQLDLILLEI